jgi:hypothetical protein
MFITAVRVERDLGVPSVSLNAPTGHRSRAPEDCGERPSYLAAGAGAGYRHLFRRAFTCTFWRLGFRQSGFRRITRISRCAAPDTWARPPVSWHAIFPCILSDSGKPSDPEISPLISARCTGDTTVRLMAHAVCKTAVGRFDSGPCLFGAHAVDGRGRLEAGESKLAGYLPPLMEWCGFESRSPDYPAVAQSAERLTIRCAPPHSPAFLSSPAAVTALAVRARVEDRRLPV